MRRRNRNFLVTIILLVLLVGLAVTEHSIALNPTPKEATPDGAMEQTPEASKGDCEQIKKDINNLQELLTDLAGKLGAAQQAFDRADEGLQKFDSSPEIKKVLQGKVVAGDDPLIGKLLETKRKLLDQRRKAKNQLEELNLTIQVIRDLIADLLNKLGDCGKQTDEATKNFVDCLQKQGAERNLIDPEQAHNPKTGQNFVWDSDKKAWIDAKTGECICPKCPATTTPPPSSKPSPAPTPTPNPTPTPTPSPTPTPNPPENKEVALLPGYHVDSNTANGLYVTTFTTPQGMIKVNLTDDVAAGDTISGTVETETSGKNDAERAQNQAELNGYVVELEGQKTKVGDKKITCNIPGVLTTQAKTIVLQLNGQTVAITEIPILVTPPPAPTQFTLPTGGQQGKPIQIKGPCDGVFSPQDHVKVGPTILPPVAKSPRSLVVQNTSDVVGPTNIECNENGAAMQCPFRNIGIKLSAPKLNLQRGETTTLHVVVMGLAGITQDVPLDLVDTTPSVIKMSGGDVQHRLINPAAVQKDGTYSMELTLTGIMAGGFGVTGTVRWSDVCTHPAVSSGVPFLIPRIERRAASPL